MSEGVEIPYSAFLAMERDLVIQRMGDGHDADGRLFWIRRYVSSTSGKIYDLSFTPGAGGEPLCTEYPKYDPSEQQ